jgi:hypothetical protein
MGAFDDGCDAGWSGVYRRDVEGKVMCFID